MDGGLCDVAIQRAVAFTVRAYAVDEGQIQLY